jgi:hypothetical protein
MPVVLVVMKVPVVLEHGATTGILASGGLSSVVLDRRIQTQARHRMIPSLTCTSAVVPLNTHKLEEQSRKGLLRRHSLLPRHRCCHPD